MIEYRLAGPDKERRMDMKLKLGEKVQYKKCLIKSNWMRRDIDEEATKEFAIKNGMKYDVGDDIYIGGFTVFSKWKVKSYPTMQTGIVCGVRTIDITGEYDFSEGVWIFGKRKKVYLVARNLAIIDRVPEEFILG